MSGFYADNKAGNERAWLDAIVRSSHDAIVGQDADGTIVAWNPAAERLYGFSAAEVIGRSTHVLVPPETQRWQDELMKRVLSGDTPGPTDLRHRDRRGNPLDVTLSLSPVLGPDDAVIGASWFCRPVSESALRESERRLQELANNTDVGFFLREATEFLYLSPGFVKIFEGTHPDLGAAAYLSYESLVESVVPEDRKIAADMAHLNADSGQVQRELRIVRRDGSTRWVRSSVQPVPGPPGSTLRIAGTVEDITERKTAEAALRSARREADRANTAKSEFLSRMSHELRTPLNAVLGFAQLLQLDELNEAQDNAVRHILRGGRHLLEMINDVLDISRIETDQLDLSTEAVQADELISDAIGLMRPMAVDHDVELFYAHAPADQYVMVDRRRLQQVLLNLLSNAIKYNRRGGSVRVSCGTVEQGRLALSVADTGRGIRREDLHRLFTPFDRLGEQSADVEGTGIGLALSQRLVTIMDGRLEVESVPGEGTTFTVLVPVTASPHTQAATDLETHGADPIRATTRSTLLYIEDNSSNVQLLERIINRRPGWSILHAGHGSVGLDFARSAAPSLILLDLHLPDMNGIDVLRQLQADPATADIPLVVVSADASASQIQRLYAAGAQHYMTKPLNVAEVLRLLDQHAVLAGAGDA